MLQYVISTFGLSNNNLEIYEREFGHSIPHEVFYRQVQPEEKPLQMFVLWKLNGESKSFVLADHDPNVRKYEKFSHLELEKSLNRLKEEEDSLIQDIKDNYQKAKQVIKQALAQ